jgi:hypothetical protein
MADEYRVTIRLSPELYAQLQARGSHGQPLAAIVRQAVVEYLARQPEKPASTGELVLAVAAMAARLDGLQDRVEGLAARLETLAAQGQPPADDLQPPRADTAARPAQADAPPGPRPPRQTPARRASPCPDGGIRHLAGLGVSVSTE